MCSSPDNGGIYDTTTTMAASMQCKISTSLLYRAQNSGVYRIFMFRISKRNKSDGHNHNLENVKNIFKDHNHEYGVFRSYTVSAPTRLVPSSFSIAKLAMLPYVKNKDGEDVNVYTFQKKTDDKLASYYLNFNHLFENGFRKVNDILDRLEDDPEVQFEGEDEKLHRSLKKLDDFICNKDYHEDCLFDLAIPEHNGQRLYTELDTKILLVNHLFNPLITSWSENFPSCLVSSDAKRKRSDGKKCPCEDEHCRREVRFADTTFGSPILWHGKLDIILLPFGLGGPPVVQTGISELNQLRTMSNEARILSQTLTYAEFQTDFMQKHMDTFISLIPIIAVSRRSFDIYFYDTESDILLRNIDFYKIFREKNCNSSLPIFKEVKKKNPTSFRYEFDLDSILLLWMTIHHSILCPEIPKLALHELAGSCAFKSILEGEECLQIENIRKDIQFCTSSKMKKRLLKQEDREKQLKPESFIFDAHQGWDSSCSM